MKTRTVALFSLLSLVALTNSASKTARARTSDSGTGSQQPQTLTIQLQPFLSGLSTPVYVTSAHDGTNRLFIVEQGGAIKVVQPGSTTPTVFLDISSKVIFGGEQGLLGLAFHPQFRINKRFFVDYARSGDGATVIAEYQASGDPNVASTAEKIMLTVPQPFANHNGGMIEFGPDGFLYIAKGDGGSANDPGNRAQNINELHGKILRIDIDHPNGSVPYSSPPSNPFFGNPNAQPEIYSLGMRNPWRFSFERGTGKLYCGDVGQGAWEEVDIITLGGNYGWRVFEGNHCTNIDPCVSTGMTFPILEYGHTLGRCCIIGGYAYRGTISTLPAGNYVYADLCTSEIFMFDGTTQTVLTTLGSSVSSFGEDEAGEIYVVGINAGVVEKIVNSAQTCSTSLSSARQSFPRAGGSGMVNVTASSCNWTSAASASWVTITSGGSGSSSGTLQYSVAPNPGLASRRTTLSIAGQVLTIDQTGASVKELPDFDADSKTDFSIWRASTGVWWIINSSNQSITTQGWGLPNMGDVVVPGDYDGDGKTDIAIWRGSTGQWWIINSSTGSVTTTSWGLPNRGDIPVPGDYDGDGKTDLAIWRASTGVWWIINSSDGSITTRGWGLPNMGDIPVPGDFDGDGKTDMTIWRGSTGQWWVINSSDGSTTSKSWGLPNMGDVPVAGDFDGDGKNDFAIWRGSTGDWWIVNSSTGMVTRVNLGLASMGDVPVAADYDADGKTDLGTWRGPSGLWTVIRSSDGSTMTKMWGMSSSGDIPVPSAVR